MKGVKSTTVRQLKIETPKVIPLATEIVERQKARIKGKIGYIELKPHHLTKDLKNFLDSEGFEFEYATTESRRGKVEMAGVRVKIIPIKHTHYDGGVFIRIQEENELSYDNTNRIIGYLTKHGINIAKECVFVDEHTEEGACLFKAEE